MDKSSFVKTKIVKNAGFMILGSFQTCVNNPNKIILDECTTLQILQRTINSLRFCIPFIGSFKPIIYKQIR